MPHALPISPQASLALRRDAALTEPASHTPKRVSSVSLLGDGRALEIEHGGRIYQLRITQLNKLILTA